MVRGARASTQLFVRLCVDISRSFREESVSLSSRSQAIAGWVGSRLIVHQIVRYLSQKGSNLGEVMWRFLRVCTASLTT